MNQLPFLLNHIDYHHYLTKIPVPAPIMPKLSSMWWGGDTSTWCSSFLILLLQALSVGYPQWNPIFSFSIVKYLPPWCCHCCLYESAPISPKPLWLSPLSHQSSCSCTNHAQTATSMWWGGDISTWCSLFLILLLLALTVRYPQWSKTIWLMVFAIVFHKERVHSP